MPQKPPTRNPKDETRADAPKPKGKPVFAYTVWQKSILWNRLFHIIGAEYWIDEVMTKMERLKINPSVSHLRRKLARAGIYPPPVEMRHTEHRECWCKKCRAKKNWPSYYVKDGRAYEHHLERQAMDDEAIEDEGLREEIARLRGESPGVVIGMKERLSKRKNRRDAA